MNDKPRKSRSVHGGRSSSTAVAFLGAILIHPVAFAIAWIKGLVLGSSAVMAPTPTSMDGFEGAFGGIAELLFFYAVTLGAAPLVISLVGAWCGSILARRFSLARSGSFASTTTQQSNASSPALLVAMWASSLTIVQTIVQKLIFGILGPRAWEAFSMIVDGLHIGIWGVGIAVAFWIHRDLRVVASLVGIAIALPIVSLVGLWLPPYSLLVLSIGVLLFCLYKQRDGWGSQIRRIRKQR